MKKSLVIGIIVLVIVVGAGIAFKVISDGGSTVAITGGSSAEAAPISPLSLSGFAGYSLPTVELGGKQVPLVRVPLDTWGGYAGLIAANGGLKPNTESLFYKYGGFGVEIVLVEGAEAQLSGFVGGQYPIIWSSMDSLPLIYDAAKTDRRIIPQVIGLFDWSTGGDGIVVRGDVKNPSDLKGKTILTSGNTPYSFFLLWLLAQQGIDAKDVKVVYIGDGPEALEAFKNDKGISAWVTWTPFLTNVLDSSSPDHVPGTKLLISSGDANQLIADIYMTRLDFAREQGPIVEAFVQAVTEGQSLYEAKPAPVHQAMAELFKLEGGVAEAAQMIKTVHIANFTETQMFFDLENPISAFSIFLMSQEYNKALGTLSSEANYEPERAINTSFVEALAKKGVFAGQPNRILTSFNRQSAFDIADLESQRVVLTEDVQLYFEAQHIDFDIDSPSPEMTENRRLLKQIADKMRIMGTTVVRLVGHLDTSRLADFESRPKNELIQASTQAKLLSKRRAEFVKKVLVERYAVEAERIVTEGRGWDEPIDLENHDLNRRVEVKFVSFE